MFDKYDWMLLNNRDLKEEDDNHNIDYFRLIQNNFTDGDIHEPEPKETPEQAKMKNRNSKIDDLLK